MEVGAAMSPRNPKEYRQIHKAADAIEPKLARAFAASVQTIQRSISIGALERAIANRDVKAARRLLSIATVRDSMAEAAEIVKEATMKGGELGVESAKEAVE